MKPTITAHMIVKNEEQWVWYAISSVIDYLDKFIIFDTGSTDRTVSIIKTIKSSKIIFKEVGLVDKKQLVELRNEQIAATKTSWILLLDGDEVWPINAIAEVVKLVKKASAKISGMVVKARVPVGDLFHYQDERAGRYQLLGRSGHYNIRVYRKRPKSLWRGVYPLEAYTDEFGQPLQKCEDELILLKNEYWHLTHLPRSSKDDHKKTKYEIGNKEDVGLPEVFFNIRPSIVPSPWIGFDSTRNCVRAKFLTPFYYIKRYKLT